MSTRPNRSPALKLLHWLTAAAVAGLVAGGAYMTSLDKADPLRDDLYALHKSTGLLVLLLVALRLAVRAGSVVPPLVQRVPHRLQSLAPVMHFFLYLLLAAVPVAGYALSSAAGKPVSFFGLFELPLLVEEQKGAARVTRQLHVTLAWTLAVAALLHAAAALHHHLVLRDDTLRRMLPGRRQDP